MCFSTMHFLKICLIRPKLCLGLILLMLSLSSPAQLSKSQWDSVNVEAEDAFNAININLDSAAMLSNKLFEFVSEPYDSLVYANMLNLRAGIAFDRGNQEKALEDYIAALELRLQFDDSLNIAQNYRNIANCLYYSNDFGKSIEYATKSLKWLGSKKQHIPFKAIAYDLIALNYNYLGELDSSEQYFKKALKIIEEVPAKYDSDKSIVYSNYSSLLEEKGRINESILLLNKAISIDKKLENVSGLAWDYCQLAYLGLHSDSLEWAFFNLQTADSLVQFSSTLDSKVNVKYGYFLYYLKKGENDSALKYSDLYHQMYDSLVSLQTDENIQRIEAQFQVERKEAALQLANEKVERFKIENENKRLLIWIIGLVLTALLVVFLLYYRNVLSKQKINSMELEIKDSKLDELMSQQESKAYAAMLKGQEKERERVAQELHDRLGGTLAALKLSLKREENVVSTEDMEILDQAVAEVRSISHNLSSGAIQKYGFNQALQQLCSSLERSGGLKFSIYLHPDVASLGQAASLELYRIVQELVANTIKHADASEVSLQTNFDGNTFNLIYEDNGKGFDMKKVKQGIGLDNIKARVKKLKGQVHFDTEVGRGTIVIIELNRKK